MKSVLFGVLRQIGAHLPVGVYLTNARDIEYKTRWSQVNLLGRNLKKRFDLTHIATKPGNQNIKLKKP
jgi:hypothetical protein